MTIGGPTSRGYSGYRGVASTAAKAITNDIITFVSSPCLSVLWNFCRATEKGSALDCEVNLCGS